jgi:hypothetical protein
MTLTNKNHVPAKINSNLHSDLNIFIFPPTQTNDLKIKIYWSLILPAHFTGRKLGLLPQDRPKVEMGLRAGCLEETNF